MTYQPALDKAWEDLADLAGAKVSAVRFLGDEYAIDIARRTVLSLSCNIPARDYAAIVILHYLIRKRRLKILPRPTGDWIDFKELEGGEAYYPAFRKRTIEKIAAKYASRPDDLAVSTKRFFARKADVGDVSFVVQAFSEVPILIALYKADDEFGPDANILFDRDISGIFCTEDIVVMTEILAHAL